MGMYPSADIGYGFIIEEKDEETIRTLLDDYKKQSEFEEEFGVVVRYSSCHYFYTIFLSSAHFEAYSGCSKMPDVTKWPKDKEKLEKAAKHLGVSCKKPGFLAICDYL